MGEGMSPLAATTCAAITGTAILFVACAVTGDLALPQANWKGWLALAYMGLLGTAIAYIWFFDGVKAIGPARSAGFVHLVAGDAVYLGGFLPGRALRFALAAGAALGLARVRVLNRAAGEPAAAPANAR